eukprot:EG_transcript_15331
MTVKVQHLEKEISVRWEEQQRAQQEKAVTPSLARTPEKELQRLQRELEERREERAPGQRMASETQPLENEISVLREEQFQTQQEKAAAPSLARTQEQQQQRLQSELEEERALGQRMAADVRTLQSEMAVVRGQLQEEKDAWSVQAKEVQKLQSALGEEQAKTERVRADLKELRSEVTAVRDQLREATTARIQDRKQLEEERARTQQIMEQLAGRVLVPEFCPDPAIPKLEYSHDNRRCRYTGEKTDILSAVASCGFTSGRQQFTVLVETELLYIGVAMANAPRTGREALWQGVFLFCKDGGVYTQNGYGQLYIAKSFKAGSRVTMRLDFDKGTASYEVDGVDLGVVQGLTLPKGPLYPAVVFVG